MFRKILKKIRTVLVVLILLGIIGYWAIQQPNVQTWLSHWAASYLSNQLGAEVTIGHVEVDLWARLVLNDVLIKDQKKDTLVFIPDLRLREYHFNKETGEFRISSVSLKDPYFNLVKYEGDSVLNYHFILDYIDQYSDSTDTSASRIFLQDFDIIGGKLNYYNWNQPERGVYGIDWNRLNLKGINADIKQFTLVGDSMHANIQQLACIERSGFMLRNVQSELEYTSSEVKLSNSHVETGESTLNGDLGFKFTSIDDFDDFEHLVKMNHKFGKSEIELGELSYFVSDLKGYRKKITLSGNVRGKVSALKGNDLEIQFDDHSYFKGNINLEGLPEIDETFISLDVKSLTTNKLELDRLQIPPFDSLNYLKTPDNFASLGQVNFSGSFTGFINDFVAYGKLRTAIGDVISDISLKEDKASKEYYYEGSIGTEQFNLGIFYDDKTLGPITSNLSVNGRGITLDRMDAHFKGAIPSIYLNKYNYTNISAEGAFKRRYFDGNIEVNDPNVMMAFNGTIDFSKLVPELNFDAEMEHIDLREINILTDYNYSSISGHLRMNSKGLDFEKFEGSIHLDSLAYCSADREYLINKVVLTADRSKGLVISLNSDIAAGKLSGAFDLKELPASFEEIISNIFPNFDPPTRTHQTHNFNLELTIRDFSTISSIFIPELQIANGTRLEAVFNEPSSFFEVTVVSDSISYLGNGITGLTLDARRPDGSLYMSVSSVALSIGSDLIFDSFAIDTRTDTDTIYTAIAWGDSSSVHKGDINGKAVIKGYQTVDFLFNQSNIIINNGIWQFSPGGIISVDSSDVHFSNVDIANAFQRIGISGGISNDPTMLLELNLNSLDLSNVNPFLADDLKFYGISNGTASVRDFYRQFILMSDLTIVDLKMNDYELGDLSIESAWDNLKKRLKVNGEVEKDKSSPLRFEGYYTPLDKTKPIDLIATLNNLDLSFINEFMAEGILEINGFANGVIRVSGTPGNIQLKGDALLNEANIYINYLNTRYYIEEQIGLAPDMFTFDHIRIRDQEGNKGFLTGQIIHNVFADWNFDVLIDLEEPMLALNTTEEMNSMYYGKAFTTGYVNIYGYEDQLEFDVSVRSEKGTHLSMPMNSSDEITFENFIRFVNAQDKPNEEPLDLSGIKLNIKFDITPDAELEIIFDEAVGDVMSGNGTGSISMEINNLSTFNMYGQVEVAKGNYLFTLKNLLNKNFIVKPGGTISWYGDPFGAELNLQAVYRVSASLYTIVPDIATSAGQRVPVDLVMNLTGKMMNPGVDFQVSLPTVDEVTRSRVASVISTEQERNRQAFALLVLRQFVSPPTITADRGTSAGALAAANSSELLSSQISNWLSQISGDFNLGFNYRPGDDISNEEIALALSTQLFDEKLSISGNFGVSRGNSVNAQPTNLIGDIRIEYKITPEGKIRLVVYNQSNEFTIATTQQSPYTQGVGVIYQQDFDNWDQFVCGFKQLFVRRKNQTDCI